MASFIACPGCGCPAKNDEPSCPHCGVSLRTAADGSLPRTAAAMMLGLATAIAACGDSTSDSAPLYGVAGTGGFEQGGDGPGGADEGGAGGAASQGGGGEAASFYGVAGTGGLGGTGQGGGR